MADNENQDSALDQMRLAELTAEIVSAYVANNTIRPAELPDVIRAVQASLQPDGKEQEPPKAAPAVPVRKSVTQDHITCLVCGKKQKTLKRHLATAHSLSPIEYREQYGLNSDYPMVAPAYSTARSEMAKQIGLGRKQGQGKAAQRRGGRRRRSASGDQPAA